MSSSVAVLPYIGRSLFTFAWGTVALLTWATIWVLQLCIIATFGLFTTIEQRQDLCGPPFRILNMLTMEVLNPFWKLTILKPLIPSHLPRGRRVIFMFNHLSNADPWMCVRVMLPYAIESKWICKSELFSYPFGGWCLANNGDLRVHLEQQPDGKWRAVKTTVKQLMTDSAAVLRRGIPLTVFPEGRRTDFPLGPLQEFKAGFFQLAVQEDAIIVPVALSGSQDMMPRGSWQFGVGHCYASVGTHVDSRGRTAAELVVMVRDTIDTMRETHPDRVALRG